MTAVYCRHCGTRVTDPAWRTTGFCDATCRERHDAPPEPWVVSPGAFIEWPVGGGDS